MNFIIDRLQRMHEYDKFLLDKVKSNPKAASLIIVGIVLTVLAIFVFFLRKLTHPRTHFYTLPPLPTTSLPTTPLPPLNITPIQPLPPLNITPIQPLLPLPNSIQELLSNRSTSTPNPINPPAPAPRTPSPLLDPLWERREIIPLITALEEQMSTPEGMNWTPPHYFRETPQLHPTGSQAAELPHLDKYAVDLTAEAAQGRLKPAVGRDLELRQIAEVFGRSRNNTPIILGAPGSGKSTIAEILAQKIVEGDPSLPPIFHGKRVYLLQKDKLALGAVKYSGDTLESRTSHIIDEILRNRDSVIIFVDDIDTLDTWDFKIMDYLRPLISEGMSPCIAATTPWNFQGMILTNPSLQKHFTTIEMQQPSSQVVEEMITTALRPIEIYHGIRFEHTAIQEAITLTDRFMKNRNHPDKAIDILDKAASVVRARSPRRPENEGIKKLLKLLMLFKVQFSESDIRAHIELKINEYINRFQDTVSGDDIRSVIASEVKIPLQRIQEDERELLRSLDDKLKAKIISQDRAIEVLCQSIRRSRLGIGIRNMSGGVHLFLGPSGVGKTEVVKCLCEELYGSEKDHLLRLDMSEFTNQADINKLIGSPVGYEGSKAGGRLTNWIKSHPRGVVLIDEVEKAHPMIFNTFLQVFDAGRLTDGLGKTVECQDIMFIMTSNIGASAILSNGNQIIEGVAEQISPLLKERFSLEFLGRIQEIVYFNPLTTDSIRQIATIQLEKLRNNIRNHRQYTGLNVSWDESFLSFVCRLGYKPESGVRELQHCISRQMENPITDALIQQSYPSGTTFHFTAPNGVVQMTVLDSNTAPPAEIATIVSTLPEDLR